MQLKVRASRIVFIFVIFAGFLFFFLGRLVWIQFSRASFLSTLAAKQHTTYLELAPQRGLIFDRNMKPLALNVVSYSLFAVPADVEDKEEAAGRLSSIFGADAAFLRERLSRRKQFVWLRRKLSFDEMEQVKQLGLAGLAFIKETKRSYPQGRFASHLIGFAGIDNEGLEGVEMVFNSSLKGTSGWTRILRDAKKRELALTDVIQPPVDGHSVVLTIDEVVQNIVKREIQKVFKKTRALGAMAVVLDVHSGEILAMANRPTFDLNAYRTAPPEARRNRAVTDFFEPGSVFKIVTAAAALDEEKVLVTDRFFCENGKYRVANHTLHDAHPYGWLTFEEVIRYSSNIGTTKVAQKIGGESVNEYAKLLGFGVSTLSGLPGEVAGILKPVSRWSKTSIGAVPIGQEVAVTALQLASATATIANGGVYMKPLIVRAIVDRRGEVIQRFQPQRLRRALSETAARQLREILTGVVARGTGKRARSKIFEMAGKTGTAQKVEANGTYSHSKFMASFIGFAPAAAPEIAVVVVVDEPRPYYYGGIVAAPVFKRIAEDVLKYRRHSQETRSK